MQDACVTTPSDFAKGGLANETAQDQPKDYCCGGEEDTWRVLGSLSLGLLVYLAIVAALVRWVHPVLSDAAAFIPEFRRFVRPEPMERMLYLVGLISIPTLPTLFYGLLTCCGRRLPRLGRCLANPCGLAVRDGLIVVVVLAWLIFLARGSEIPAASYYLAASSLLAVLASLACPTDVFGVQRVVAAFHRRRAAYRTESGDKSPHSKRAWVVRLAAAGLILTAGALLLREQSSIGRQFGATYHFDLLLGAVNQVMHGRTILVDTTSQYGILYPYVAAAVVAPFGLSVTHLGLFFVGLAMSAMALIYLIFALKMGSGAPGTLVGLLATLAVLHPFGAGVLFDLGPSALYYQYFPLRVICGVFFLWFSGVYFRRPSRRLMLAGYLAAAVSVLWNADTGMVVLVAWTASLMVEAVCEVSQMALSSSGARRQSVGNALSGVPDAGSETSCLPRNATEDVPYRRRTKEGVPDRRRTPVMCLARIVGRIAGYLSLAVLTVVLSVAGYALFAWIRSGRLPDVTAYWKYQEIFYAAGFFMLPMKHIELWQPIILLYLLVVAAGVRRALLGTADAASRWHLFVALYGLGIFSYYQGRSHVYCLVGVLYPAMILACLLSADLVAAWRAAGYSFKNPEARFTWMKLAGCWLLVGFGVIHFGRALPAAVTHLVRGRPREASIYNEAEIEPLRKRLEGSAAVILSPVSNYLHVRTHSYSALPFSSPAEIILLAQAREAREALNGRGKVYLIDDPSEKGVLLRYLRPEGFQEVQRIEDLTVHRDESTIPKHGG